MSALSHYRIAMLKSHERFAICLLKQNGRSIREIKRITGHDRRSIRNVLFEQSFHAAPAPQGKRRTAGRYAWFAHDPSGLMQERRGRRSLLEPFRTRLMETFSKGAVCAVAVLDDLRKWGY